MTFFEFIVPVIALALAVAGVGILYAIWSGRRLDRQGRDRHPAE